MSCPAHRCSRSSPSADASTDASIIACAFAGANASASTSADASTDTGAYANTIASTDTDAYASTVTSTVPRHDAASSAHAHASYKYLQPHGQKIDAWAGTEKRMDQYAQSNMLTLCRAMPPAPHNTAAHQEYPGELEDVRPVQTVTRQLHRQRAWRGRGGQILPPSNVTETVRRMSHPSSTFDRKPKMSK